MSSDPQQQACRTAADHKPDGLSKPGSQAKPQPTDGCGSHPSARPQFPTVASAIGIKHGRPPAIPRIKGLQKPQQPAHAMIQIQSSVEYRNDEFRRDRIRCSGVR